MLRIISTLFLAATMAFAHAAEPLELVDNPPERHIVVKGDTLWGISGKFLKDPWRWPDIWRMNQEQIRNPHLIYPGDIVWLDHTDGSPRLRLGKPVGSNKVQPKVYATPIQAQIPSIPPNVIEPLISQPLIVEPGIEKTAARIIATQEDRFVLGSGDTAFVTRIEDAEVSKWHLFRPGKPLKDPETGQTIAYEAFFLGDATLVQTGDPATIRITSAREEIARGDWLMPAPVQQILAYVPRRPNVDVDARIMSIYGGLSEGGTHSVISLSRGEADGLERGHVVALYRKRTAIGLDEQQRRLTTVLPEERYALAFIFRTFDRVAYALVVESSKSVMVGDAARNP